MAGCTTTGTAPSAAVGIHARVIAFDAEMDIPLDFMSSDKDAGKDTPMQVDLPKMDADKLDGAAIEKMLSTYPERSRSRGGPTMCRRL